MTSRAALTLRKRRAIECLVRGLSKQATAETVGVQPSTISRYMRDAKFVASLREAQSQALGEVGRSLVAGSRAMLAVLAKMAADETTPSSVRVRAALGWLAQVWRAVELGDLAQRIAALEETVNNTR